MQVCLIFLHSLMETKNFPNLDYCHWQPFQLEEKKRSEGIIIIIKTILKKSFFSFFRGHEYILNLFVLYSYLVLRGWMWMVLSSCRPRLCVCV